jgi:hypothetical protein
LAAPGLDARRALKEQKEMSFRRDLLFFCVALAASACAADPDRVDFQTRDGRVFTNVKAKRVAGRTLEVTTESGSQLLRFADLPPAIQERFFEPSMMHPPVVGDLLDFKTKDGRAFKGRLMAIAPNGITVGIPDGVEKVPYAKLPPELANSFDFDAKDALLYEREQQRLFAARQAAELEAQKKALKGTPKPSGKSSSGHGKMTPVPSLGESGRKQLGVPKLGGSGLGK